MKKFILALAVSALAAIPVSAQSISVSSYEAVPAGADSRCQWINGYVRKDGTYVQGHWRGC